MGFFDKPTLPFLRIDKGHLGFLKMDKGHQKIVTRDRDLFLSPTSDFCTY